MSTYAIKTFHSDLERLKHFGGSNKETAIRFAFQKLLDEYAKSKDLMLIPEISLKTRSGKTVTPDGTLKDRLRLDHGYWESKDEADDIDEEIQKKFAKHYPNDNIIFEDSNVAVLIQHGQEVMRTKLDDEEVLDKLLTKFVSFERKEITDFRQAIDKFREDIPKVTETLHHIIQQQFGDSSSQAEGSGQSAGSTTKQSTSIEQIASPNNKARNDVFYTAFLAFHEMAKQSINPDINEEDIKEMMVQHILSADIFNTIFDEAHFHQENNIARELNKVIDTFFTGTTRRTTLGSIQHYYQTINAAAAGIIDHHEKQKFLKVVYENFYKAYNPKAADRLGTVYTPNEIVQFMIKSTDYLLHKHFGKTLADKNVDILDPATGTGTFICDIIDFLPKNKLEYKYKHELHANELAILPYYIANLNIEYTYKQKMGSYAEFESLCLVDTLDNTGFNWVGKQGDLFGVSAENAKRIKKQNQRKISVIIGNPPYNAKQENYNFQNANRGYKEIDKRIKDTYIKQGKAQSQIVVYDMYTRFYRWAMDRLNENGVIAFITNRSFIDGRAFDGFRKTIQTEFDYAYIIDTKSDVRANPKIAGSTHNVFGIQAGVAILLLVKTSTGKLKEHNCRIQYVVMEDEWRKEEKLQWFSEHPIEKIEFENIQPDKNNNWININNNDWESLIELFNKDSKVGKNERTLFKSFTLGVASHRDNWVYDYSENGLEQKIKYFLETYNESIHKGEVVRKIAWDDDLMRLYTKKKNIKFDSKKIIIASFRPFLKKYFYCDESLISRLYSWPSIFQNNNDNLFISFRCISSDDQLSALATNNISDLGYLKTGNGGTFSIGQFRYDNDNKKVDNITDWGYQQFNQYYHDGQPASSYPADTDLIHSLPITKEEIFNYVYAVLHHTAYRSKYALNLKREFPRIPFYDDFYQWAEWGKQLMELHIGYETVEPYPLQLLETTYEATNIAALEKMKKAKLKADKASGRIELDGFTTLTNIPAAAWNYKLGNRSALEWILDQYKEKKPGDPTIAEKFNTYKFADYKEQVIDLLMRVCTVSVETMKIVDSMPE